MKLLMSVFTFFTLISCVMPQKIGVVWPGKSKMQTRLMKGFEERLQEKAPHLDVEVAGDLADYDTAVRKFKKFEKSKDAVIFLRSYGCKFFKDYKPEKPSFFGGCNNPVILGAVENPERPEGMVTGVTYALPYLRHFETFRKILPKMSSVCLIVEKDHPSSQVDREGTKAACKALGIEYHEIAEKSIARILEDVAEKKQKVDAFLVGQQELVFDNAKAIVQASGQTPVLTYVKDTVHDGCLCAIAVNDEKLGRFLADSVIDVIVKGRQISETPVKTDPYPRLIINVPALKKHNIIVPLRLLKLATKVKKNRE